MKGIERVMSISRLIALKKLLKSTKGSLMCTSLNVEQFRSLIDKLPYLNLGGHYEIRNCGRNNF